MTKTPSGVRERRRARVNAGQSERQPNPFA